jgi:heme/copper-type cytochrome/quinol oxidase subunit 2
MLAATNASIIWNGILLASAVVPVLIVIVICIVFMRAARRNDEREALEKLNQQPTQ